MGLDHGLHKRHYVKNWSFMKAAELHEINVLKGGKKDNSIDANRIMYIVEEIVTWRKAYHIHRWFVENIQEGKDNFQVYLVTEQQLVALLDTCRKVLGASRLIPGRVHAGIVSRPGGGWVEQFEDGFVIEDATKAEKLLPAIEGLFYGGSTPYDAWYLDNVRETVTILERELRNRPRDEVSFEYWSS